MTPRSADSLVAPAVATSLSALDLGDRDQAAARLAERYADVIDRAAFAAGAAERALRSAIASGDLDTADALRDLRKLLSEQSTLDRLGRRLEDVLDALGATPRSAARTVGPPPAPTGPSRLERMRQGRVS